MAGLRALSELDAEQALALSVAEGWNQTKDDWLFLINNPENHCLAYESNGRIVGTSTALNFSNDLAWIGMVLVDKEFRGQGISKLLLKNIIESLQLVKSIKLDATPAGLPIYQNFGFRNEYKIYRFILEPEHGNIPANDRSAIQHKLHNLHIPYIVAYDHECYGINRSKLIQYLGNSTPEKFRVHKVDQHTTGYIFGRNGYFSQYIGPLIANDFNAAQNLFIDIMASMKDQPVVVDVPEYQSQFIEWLNQLGFKNMRYFIRMVYKEHVDVEKPERQFLIGGPEFG